MGDLRWPANDNAPTEVRSLTADDVLIILGEHAASLGVTVDAVTHDVKDAANPLRTAIVVLCQLPDLQRSIAWRGSWLKRPQIDILDDVQLLQLCFEVVLSTWSEFAPSSISDAIQEAVRPFSRHLAGTAA